MANITVLGAGAWGTAFGQVLADAGNDVMMWAIEPDIVKAIRPSTEIRFACRAWKSCPTR